jgi:ABC-type glycerol-3-phosphate transport system substrate-binding protein
MYLRLDHRLTLLSLCMLLLIAGCGSPGIAPSKRATPLAYSTGTTPQVTGDSRVTFTLTGGQNASYTLDAAIPTSKLRHGHREFTINVVDADLSLFIVFYGYQGPASYTLSSAVNGGDVHIGLQNDEFSWDLYMQPTASCSLVVASETTTNKVGLDRLKGSFACAHLLSSSPEHPERPVTVTNGSFDIAIVVES